MFHREEIVMKGGNLVQAMRASMAIPGVFTPVRTGDRVLVDGGILNNFPTDVARELGAEIVIGVDVQADLMKEDKLESVSGVIPQIINLLCMNKHEANVKLADLVIRPDMKGYTAASFSARSIDEINVQVMMEKLGGGGHRTIAGAQLKDATPEEAKDRLKEIITQMMEKGDI